MATPEPTAFLSVALTEIDFTASFFEEGRYQGACAECGRIKGEWEVHHVLFRQHCRRYGAPEWSPDNALRLCSGDPGRCHEREHSRQARIGISHLRDENLAFMLHHLGAGLAYNTLMRYYLDDGDPRLDVLLEQRE